MAYKKILTLLVEDVNKLAKHGIMIRHTCLTGHIHAAVADNLARHRICGVQQLFSTGRIWRFCKAWKDQINNYFDGSDFVLSTTDVHKYLLALWRVWSILTQPNLCRQMRCTRCWRVLSRGHLSGSSFPAFSPCLITDLDYGRMDRDSKPPTVTNQPIFVLSKAALHKSVACLEF